MLVGLLFLIATVSFIIADKLIVGVLERPDFLSSASGYTGALAAGALLAFVDGLCLVGIAVALFPLLKRHSEPLALAYVGLRVAELAATLLYVAIPLLAIKLGGGVTAGTVDASATHQLGALLQAQHGVAVVMIYLVNAVNGSIVAYLLYRSQLIPRPIAILGLIGYPVLLAGGILSVFDVTSVTEGAGLVAVVPGGLYELILPIWLLTKGFAAPPRIPES